MKCCVSTVSTRVKPILTGCQPPRAPWAQDLARGQVSCPGRGPGCRGLRGGGTYESMLRGAPMRDIMPLGQKSCSSKLPRRG